MKHPLRLAVLLIGLAVTAGMPIDTRAADAVKFPNAALFSAEPRPFSVTKYDDALDSIISPDAKLELIAGGFGLNKGIIWVRDGDGGHLLVGDLAGNAIYKISPDRTVSLYLDDAGYTGNDIYHAGYQTKRGRVAVLLIGPNGEYIDPQGRLVWCASPDRTVVRLEKDGTRTVLASTFEGKRFNGPNDLVIRSDGAIYFTDSDFGLRFGKNSPERELSFDGVYLIKDGKVSLLLDDKTLGSFSDGIAMSPDERYLYLSAGFKRMMRYEIRPDGTLGKGSVFFDGGPPGGFGNGMKTDLKGDLFSTNGAGPGVVRISSPEGKLLGTINLPVYGTEPKRQICATDVAFGDPDGKGLYIAACEAVYKVRLKSAGVIPGLIAH
jgi:gluconolactonase